MFLTILPRQYYFVNFLTNFAGNVFLFQDNVFASWIFNNRYNIRTACRTSFEDYARFMKNISYCCQNSMISNCFLSFTGLVQTDLRLLRVAYMNYPAISTSHCRSFHIRNTKICFTLDVENFHERFQSFRSISLMKLSFFVWCNMCFC